MTGHSAKRLRAAIEGETFESGQKALDEYLAWFRSAPRTHAEVSEARDVCAWAVETMLDRRACLAQKLGRLRTLIGGYRGTPIAHTWHIDG